MAECIKELFLEVLRCGRRYSSLHLYLRIGGLLQCRAARRLRRIPPVAQPAGVAQKKAQNGIRRGGAKALLLFSREGEPLSFLLYFFSFGRGCYTQDVSMLCVCNYTGESAERKEKVSAPVVRNKRWRVTVGNRKLGSPSGG